MPTTFDPTEWRDPLMKVIVGQAANLSRIKPGVVLDGTDDEGNPITLLGPKPDIVRLHSTPAIIQSRPIHEVAEYVITLAPIGDATRDRIVNRDGRQVEYGILLWVKLSADELKLDTKEQGTGNILARKVDAALYDFHAVFFDDLLLQDVGCEGGIVDDARYDIDWSPEVVYPAEMVVVTVSATLHKFRHV